MFKILVIYYTQSGQLKRILDNLLSPILQKDHIQINYLELKPAKPYPFPWGKEFFDCFPESVEETPCEMEPNTIPNTDYDLIILGHQPWFLSPSIPITSFLKGRTAPDLFKNKKVVTVIGARNMWCSAQEAVKTQLHNLDAQLIGNIVLQDRNDNILSAITIARWLLHGNKGPYRLLPEAGVSEKEVNSAEKYGQLIEESISTTKLESLHENLLLAKAVTVKFHLLRMELTAKRIFAKFSKLAIRKGSISTLKRKQVVKIFKAYLIFALFILSPLVSLLFMILRIILFPWVNKQLYYYKGISLKN